VNEQIVEELGTKVDPDKDRVCFKGRQIRLKQASPLIYIALNKPKGFVTSCSQQDTKIILDLVDIDDRVYPVGRLDKDSTGLVLLINDGDLHNQLSHPSFNHEKEYIVTTVHPISDDALQEMARGMVIKGKKTRKALVKRLGKNKFRIVLKQGLNRQIRKMVGKSGNAVADLNRIRMASICLGNLKPGQWRHLTVSEIRQLKTADLTQ
jgi:23S rRNA pseudouridine2605 synthase/23S rRNA pseudouridine2604 synthase